MTKAKNQNKVNSYLSFKIDNEEFAIHVESVLNILEMTRITEVPKAPTYMKGVINLRGTVLPIVDTRLKFGLKEIQYTEKTCIIVMEVFIDKQKILLGSLVDEVISVIEFDDKDILPPPSIGNKFKSEFITGVIVDNEKFIMILDINKIYSGDELSILKENTQEVTETE